MDRRPSPRVHRPAGEVGGRAPDRDSRRGLLRADPGNDPLSGPDRTDSRLLALAAKPSRRHRPRSVDAGTRLGAILRPRPGRRRHRIHRPGRLPLPLCRAGAVATDRPLPDRGRRPPALGLPRQRTAPLPDSVRRPAADDRLSGPDVRAEPERGGRLRRRRREVRRLAGDQQARLPKRLAGAVFPGPGRQPAVDQRDHAGRGAGQRAAGRQDISAHVQLSRDDRMGAAGREPHRV